MTISPGEAGSLAYAISWDPGALLATPTTPVPTTSPTGGTVLAGIYGVEISYVNALGETLATVNAPITTTGTTSTITVPSPPALGTGLGAATGYYVYMTQVGGATFTRQQVAGTPTAIATPFVLTAPPSSGGLAPPAKNTTQGNQKGTPAPTQFLLVESTTLAETFDNIERLAMIQSPDADVGYRHGMSVDGGAITLGMYPGNGIDILSAILGKRVPVLAVTPDTTTATSFDANGNVLLTLTTGGTYANGSLVVYGPLGLTQEVLPVIAYNAGTKVLTLPAPQNTHAAVGETVEKKAQNLDVEYDRSDVVGGVKLIAEIRRFYLEEAVGSGYSNAYINMFPGKYALKSAAAKVDVTVDWVSDGAQRLSAIASPTAFNDADPTLSNLSFEFYQAYWVTMDDPANAGVGTAALQYYGSALDWTLTIDRKPTPVMVANRTRAKRHMNTTRQMDLTFTAVNEHTRPYWFTEYAARDVDFPWYSVYVDNIGTPTVPIWKAMCFYAPAARVIAPTTETKAIGAPVGETVNVRLRKSGVLQKLYVYSL